MSIHQRVKYPDNNEIRAIKNKASSILTIAGFLFFSTGGLYFAYIVKSAMGIDLIPGWSLFH